MKVNIASNILKILLVLFALGAIVFGIFILPIMAEQMTDINSEVAYAKVPILIVCETLLVLLLVGIGIILRLLLVFDRGKTFSQTFIRGLEILTGMCLIVSIVLIVLFKYIETLGGPDPFTGLIMVALIFVILIVASVIMLIRSIVKKAMVYKDDYDLTV